MPEQKSDLGAWQRLKVSFLLLWDDMMIIASKRWAEAIGKETLITINDYFHPPMQVITPTKTKEDEILNKNLKDSGIMDLPLPDGSGLHS